MYIYTYMYIYMLVYNEMILFIIIKLSATTLNPLKGEVRLSIHVDVITCNTHLKPLSCRPRGQLVTRQQPKVAREKCAFPVWLASGCWVKLVAKRYHLQIATITQRARGDADLSANACQLLVEQNGNGVKVAPIET